MRCPRWMSVSQPAERFEASQFERRKHLQEVADIVIRWWSLLFSVYNFPASHRYLYPHVMMFYNRTLLSSH